MNKNEWITRLENTIAELKKESAEAVEKGDYPKSRDIDNRIRKIERRLDRRKAMLEVPKGAQLQENLPKATTEAQSQKTRSKMSNASFVGLLAFPILGGVLSIFLISFVLTRPDAENPINSNLNNETNTNVVKTKEQLDREELFSKFQNYVKTHYDDIDRWQVTSFRQEDISINTDTKKTRYYLVVKDTFDIKPDKILLVQEGDFTNSDGSTELRLYEPRGTATSQNDDDRDEY